MKQACFLNRLLVAVVVGPVCVVHAGTIVFVDQSATGPVHDGGTWCTAFLDLQDAIASALPGQTIKVADGAYRPDPTGLADPRDAAFAMPSGVILEGGYAGCDAMNPDARDVDLFETILSGDLTDNDGPEFTNRDDNVYHVVTTHDVDDSTIVDGFTISGGHADGPNFGPSTESRDQGSGVNNYHGQPQMIDCTFLDNFATNHGAFNDHGGATLADCTFSVNHADTLAGGLYSHTATVTTVIGCSFIGNGTLGDGAGAYLRSTNSSTFTNCQFSQNEASRGGGLYVQGNSDPTLTGCTFSNNTAAAKGGGLYVQDSDVSLDDCSFDGEGFPNVHAVLGGGIYCQSSDVTAVGCSFADLITTFDLEGDKAKGAGMYALESLVSFESCSFARNHVFGGAEPLAGGGGGIYVQDTTMTVTGSVLNDNFGNRYGGAIYATGVSDVTITNSTFFDNHVSYGNAIANRGDAVMTVTGSVFTQNFGGNIGGAVLHSGQFLSVTESSFDQNSSAAGGALHLTGSAAITNCRFVGNHSSTRGGGLLIETHAAPPVAVANCIFSGNSAETFGGAVRVIASSPVFSNCTFAGNTTDGGGGGVSVWTGVPEFRNCIMWNNSDSVGTDEQAQIHLDGEFGPAEAIVNYSTIEGLSAASGGIGNIAVDPLFPDADGPDDNVGTLDDDLRLLSGSPGIDAGDNSLVPVGVTTDLADRSRFRDDPAVPDTGRGGGPIVDMGAFEAGGDCNLNGTRDDDDIIAGGSLDVDSNGIPDECEPATAVAIGGRYLLVMPSFAAGDIALHVKGDPNDPANSCLSQYVQLDGSLGETPAFRPRASWGAVALTGADIQPETTYLVEIDDGIDLTPAGIAVTWRWGDVNNNDVTNLIDARLIVKGFQGIFIGATRESTDLEPCMPNQVINLIDAQRSVKAFQGDSFSSLNCATPCPG